MVERKHVPGDKKGTSNRFERIRLDHAREMAEDYAEMVLELEAVGSLRPADLARELGVSHVTVLRTLDRLVRSGVLIRDDTQGIRLSAEGRALGEASRNRHRLVVAFLERLGVPPEIAAVDGEGIEHHVSPTTLACIVSWITQVENAK